MSDARTIYRQGEVAPLFVIVTAEAGATVTITGTPTITLYDSAGAVAGGINGANVTGSDAGASAAGGTREAWYTLNPTTLALAVGLYRARFAIVATGLDGIARTITPVVEFEVQSATVPVRPSMGRLLQRLRLLVHDPVGTTATFSDEELIQFLDRHRRYVRRLELGWADWPTYDGAGAVSYLTYVAPYGDWEESVTFQNGAYAAVTPTTADYQSGRWTWAAEPTRPIYLTGQTYDLYGAAVDVLRAWAARLKLKYDFGSADQRLQRSQMYKQCLSLAEEYRRLTRRGGAGTMNVGEYARYP